MGYYAVLQLCLVLNTDCEIEVGYGNQSADMTNLVEWLAGGSGTTYGAKRIATGQTTPFTTAFAAQGRHIYLMLVNEPWNSVNGQLVSGNGLVYGNVMGQMVAGIKAAPDYSANASTLKISGSGWFSGAQAQGGYTGNALTGAGCTLSSRGTCPDFMTYAPYLFEGGLWNVTSPNFDSYNEAVNEDSVASPGSNTTSMKAAQSYLSSNFNVNASIYEVQDSAVRGATTFTQANLNGVTMSVGNGLDIYQHMLLMIRDSKVPGPLTEFAFGDQPWGQFNFTQPPTQGSWGAEQYMAAGPGQLGSWQDADKAISIITQVGNTAIGANNNLMAVTQGGTNPLESYAGGQNSGSSNTIDSNTNTPYIQSFAFNNGSNWTLLVFNNSSSSQAISFSGAGAPTGTVTRNCFGCSNAVTDSNSNSTIANNATANVIAIPTPTTMSSPSTDTVPATSMVSYTYSTSGGGSTVTTLTPSTMAYCYVGQSCTLTATLGTTAATGTVSFYQGATLLGTSTVSSGVATYTGTFPTFGDVTYNATYSGDSTYAPIAAQYVNLLTLLNTTQVFLKSNNTTVASGASVTFTATVACTSCSSTPAGSVLLYDGNTLLGGTALTLSSGVATYATSSLSAGQHYLTAVYLSDNANYAASDSLIVNQTITAAASPCTANVSLTGAPAVYYVANNGSDSNAGTCALPYQHFSKAVSVATTAGDIILARQGDTFPESVAFALSGASGVPYVFGNYVGTGITATGPPPVVTARDTVSGTWTLVTAGTYSIPYTGYPSKVCVDSVGQECAPILPAINYKGAYAAGTFAPYDAVYDVTAAGSYFSRLTAATLSGGFNANNQSWGVIPPVPVSMQSTGLANVEGFPGYFYCNGTSCYVHLLDGSNPSSHTIQASTRKYTFDLRGASFVTLKGLSIEGATFSNVNVQPISSASSATEDHISLINDFLYNGANPLVTYDQPNEGSYYTGNLTIAPFQNSGTPYPVTNFTSSGNVYGAIDVYGQLNYNVESASIHGSTAFTSTNDLVEAVNGEGLSFQSYGAAGNTSAVLTNPVFINNQGGSRASATNAATYNNTICHDGLGFCVQVGYNVNTYLYGGLAFNLRSTRGMSDLLTLGIPGGGGTLFNGIDCNTGSASQFATGTYVYHWTIENAGGNPMTNELGCPATVRDDIFDSTNAVRPDTTYGTGAYSFWVRYQSEPSILWTNNVTVPYSAQPSNFDWKNSSSGDISISFQQHELNNNGQLDIQPNAVNYTNRSIGNYTLQSTSPALGTGTPIAAMGESGTVNIGWDRTTSGSAVSPGTLSSLAIFSGYPNATQFGFNTLGVGTRMAFAATGTYADGSKRSIPAGFITWASSNTAGATIPASGSTVTTASPAQGAVATNGAFGLLTALATGTTNVTAAYGGKTSPTYAVTLTAGTPIPVASPASGTYTGAQSVTLSSTDSAASIYYTLDGSTPTTASTRYTAALTVAASETINAIGYNPSGPYTSSVGSFPYTINSVPVTATPTFSPGTGTYTTTQSVVIATSTSGATIYYTVDGSTPTTSSAVYSAPVSVGISKTLKAIAVASGYTTSAVGSATYIFSAGCKNYVIITGANLATVITGGKVTIPVVCQ